MQCAVEWLLQLSAASKGFLEPLLLLTISSVEWSKTIYEGMTQKAGRH